MSSECHSPRASSGFYLLSASRRRMEDTEPERGLHFTFQYGCAVMACKTKTPQHSDSILLYEIMFLNKLLTYDYENINGRSRL